MVRALILATAVVLSEGSIIWSPSNFLGTEVPSVSSTMLGQVNLGCSDTEDVEIGSINATIKTPQGCIDKCADTYHCNFVVFSDTGVGDNALKFSICSMYETCDHQTTTANVPSQAYQILEPKSLPTGSHQIGSTGQMCGSGEAVASTRTVSDLGSCVNACQQSTECEYVDVVVASGAYDCKPMKACADFKTATKKINRMYQVSGVATHSPTKAPTSPTNGPTTSPSAQPTNGPTATTVATTPAAVTQQALDTTHAPTAVPVPEIDKGWQNDDRKVMIGFGAFGAVLWLICGCTVGINMARRQQTGKKKELQTMSTNASHAKADIPTSTPLMPSVEEVAPVQEDLVPSVTSPSPSQFKAATRYDSSPAV